LSKTTGSSYSRYGKIHPMIVAGTSPPININIDLGSNEQGMTVELHPILIQIELIFAFDVDPPKSDDEAAIAR
jgi:hypothetical protein